VLIFEQIEEIIEGGAAAARAHRASWWGDLRQVRRGKRCRGARRLRRLTSPPARGGKESVRFQRIQVRLAHVLPGRQSRMICQVFGFDPPVITNVRATLSARHVSHIVRGRRLGLKTESPRKFTSPILRLDVAHRHAYLAVTAGSSLLRPGAPADNLAKCLCGHSSDALCDDAVRGQEYVNFRAPRICTPMNPLDAKTVLVADVNQFSECAPADPTCRCLARPCG